MGENSYRFLYGYNWDPVLSTEKCPAKQHPSAVPTVAETQVRGKKSQTSISVPMSSASLTSASPVTVIASPADRQARRCCWRLRSLRRIVSSMRRLSLLAACHIVSRSSSTALHSTQSQQHADLWSTVYLHSPCPHWKPDGFNTITNDDKCYMIFKSSQVKSSLLNTRLQLKAELIHTETIEKCYA